MLRDLVSFDRKLVRIDLDSRLACSSRGSLIAQTRLADVYKARIVRKGAIFVTLL